MTLCQHDPMFTTDSRCSKCYPRKNIVMVQNDGGAQEVHPGWIVAQDVTNDEAAQVADEQMAQYGAWQENAMDWRDIKGDCAL